MSGQQLKQIDRTLWELPRTGGMRVPGRIYATKRMLPPSTMTCGSGALGRTTVLPL